MHELILLQALGLSPIEVIYYYPALRMAEKGLVPAPNAAIGEAFQISGALATTAAALASVKDKPVMSLDVV